MACKTGDGQISFQAIWYVSALSDRSDRYEFGAVRFENIDVSSVNWEEAIYRGEMSWTVFDETWSGHVRFVNCRQGHLSQLFKILQMAGASSQRIKVGCWLPLAAQVSLQHVTNEAFRCGAKDPSVLSLCEWLACTASPSETRVRVPLRNVKLSNSQM